MNTAPGRGAGRLEQVEGAGGIDLEVGERLLGRPVVGRLGRRVYDQRDVVPYSREQLIDTPLDRECRGPLCR